jgi:hypothetical protein
MSELTKSSLGVQWLKASDCVVHWHTAQRTLKQKHVDYIAANFDPDLLGVVTVTPVGNGRYHLLDGQHRVEAVKLALGADQAIPATVILDLDKCAAAIKFGKINTDRRAPTAYELFRVAVTAKNPQDTAIDKICRSLDLCVDAAPGDGRIRAVRTLQQVYRAGNLADTLGVIKAAWSTAQLAYDAHILHGVSRFLRDHGAAVDRERLAAIMAKKYTPARLIGAAKQAREMFGGKAGTACARVLLEAYNDRLRSGRLGPEEA